MEQILYLIFGGTLGFVVTFAIQNYYSIRTQDIAHLNDFLNDLIKIESLSTEYWCLESGDNEKRARDLAVLIRGALHASSDFAEVESEILMGENFTEFRRLVDELFDSSTGGSFEMSEKIRDPERVIAIMKLSNQLRAVVRRARRKTY